MDSGTAAQVRSACAGRVLARRRPPTERVLRGKNFGGTDLLISQVEGSEFMPPETLGEWLDDRLAALPWVGQHAGVLYEIAGAARTSESAALAELGRARRLTRWDQFHCLTMLLSWRDAAGELPAARSLMSALIGEWDRRLPDGRPGEPELPELPGDPGPRVLDYPTLWGRPAALPY